MEKYKNAQVIRLSELLATFGFSFFLSTKIGLRKKNFYTSDITGDSCALLATR
jgi:hypothetical protein